jgi:single-strand DNA-binding protein
MINKVILIGRMTKDCELRVTPSRTSVATFILAVNRSFQSGDGQEADFINCVAWGKLGENLNEYTSKGSLIAIEGRINTRSYENTQGQKIYVTEVICNSIEYLDTRKKEEHKEVNQNDFYNQTKDNDFKDFDIMEEDIQF